MSVFAFLNRSPKKLKIEGHHDGEIRSQRPVWVDPGATVVGDVYAPAITIEGELFGSAVCREAAVLANGKVWGDVFAAQLTVAPEGRLRGWFVELSQTAFEEAFAGETLAEVRSGQATGASSEQLPEQSSVRLEVSELDLMGRLQSEAAAATAARLELERQFDKQVEARTSAAKERAATLERSLEEARLKNGELEQQIVGLEGEVISRDTALQQITDEVAGAKIAASDQQQLIEAFEEEAARQVAAHARLRSAKEAVDVELSDMREKLERMEDRFSSLEAALQSSVQHGSEQQESLIRWQELADDTQAKADELQAEVDELRASLDAGEPEMEMLRLRHYQMEEDAKQALADLASRAEQVASLQAALEQTEEELAGAKEELTAFHDKSKDPLAQNEAVAEARKRQAIAERRLVEAEESRASLESALADSEALADERAQQLLWANANQESTRTELERVRCEALDNDSVASQLRADLEAAQSVIKDHESQIERLQAESAAVAVEGALKGAGLEELGEALKESNAAKEAMRVELLAVKESVRADEQKLEALLKQKQAELDASEVELQQHLQELDDQGQRLAEVQATLVERDLELQRLAEESDRQLGQLREQLKEQAHFIQRMKEVTSSHIQALEAQLAEVQ